MRFNKYLQTIANAYRMDFLNSVDEKDLVQRPELWTDEKVSYVIIQERPLTESSSTAIPRGHWW